MFCPNCGAPSREDSAFCLQCGTPLRTPSAPPASGFRSAPSLDESAGALPPREPPVAPPTPGVPRSVPGYVPPAPPPYRPPVPTPAPAPAPARNPGMRRISAGKEFKLLTMQYLRILLGDVKNLVVCLAFPVVAAFITVWIAGGDMFVSYEGTKSACFVLVSASIWGGLFNSIQTIVKERANIKRDLISGGLRLGCYTGSRAILQFVLCALQSAILCVAFYGVDWKYDNTMPSEGILTGSAILEFYISLVLLTFAADTMGLMISSIVRKEETASVMAPYILIVQLIFSGILFDMEGSAEIVSYAMLSRWGMEALGSISAMLDLPSKVMQMAAPIPDTEDYAAAFDMFEMSSGHLWLVWGVLLGFSVLFLVAGNLFLHRVKKDQR